MGHHHSGGETRVVVCVPPETQKLLDEQRAELKKYEQVAKDLADPTHYKNNATKLFGTFVENLDKLDLKQTIERKGTERHIGFVGPISAGKTSLINAIWDKHLPVALGHCTTSCEVVHATEKVVVWDVCGKNDDYKFYNPETLAFLKSLDTCVVVFDNDISMVSDILTVVHKLNPKSLVVVRTKLDQHNCFNVRSVETEQQLDEEKLQKLLKATIREYGVSALNIALGQGKRFQWDELMNVLQGD